MEALEKSFMHVQTDISSIVSLYQKKKKTVRENGSFLTYFHAPFHPPRIDLELSILAVKRYIVFSLKLCSVVYSFYVLFPTFKAENCALEMLNLQF